MTAEEISKKKKHGDLKTAGSMLGISEQNAYAALKRVGSKHHFMVVNILSKIIGMREQLQQEVELTNQ